MAIRPVVTPVELEGPTEGRAIEEQGARREWVAVIGPSAFADLLRLMSAARHGRAIKAPIHMTMLVRHGLVQWVDGQPAVASTLPPLPDRIYRSLPYRIRRTLTPTPGAA